MADTTFNTQEIPFDEFAGLDQAIAENANRQVAVGPTEWASEEDNLLTLVESQKQALAEEALMTANANEFSSYEAYLNAEDQKIIEGLAPDTAGFESLINSFVSSNNYTSDNSKQKATKVSAYPAFDKTGDWRVRLSLAPGADYLYAAANPGILAPLVQTGGVIFPYTPSIQVAYTANYDNTTLTHSNYKIFQYGSSSVDNITITCDFTAQDSTEASYMLAVIHFFKSVTKMFYGKDSSPRSGTPPPLCYLTGLGEFQFDNHPLAITSFNYSLPTDVDYVRTGPVSQSSQLNASVPASTQTGISPSSGRLAASNISPGGRSASVQWATSTVSKRQVTYVPTKMQISVTAVPIVSRNDISNEFSLKKFASGELLRGSKRSGGGIW